MVVVFEVALRVADGRGGRFKCRLSRISTPTRGERHYSGGCSGVRRALAYLFCCSRGSGTRCGSMEPIDPHFFNRIAQFKHAARRVDVVGDGTVMQWVNDVHSTTSFLWLRYGARTRSASSWARQLWPAVAGQGRLR